MRRRTVALVLVLMLAFATGCWDARSLDQRAFVVMVGVDVTPDGQFKASMQIQPAGYDQQPRASGQGAPPQQQVVVNTGETLRQALEKVQDDLARSLDFIFMNVLVISEAVARHHLDDLDWLLRGYGFPVSVSVAITPGEAEAVVRGRAEGYSMSAQFADFSMSGGSWNRSPALVQGHLWLMWNRNWFTPLEDMYAPVLTTTKGDLNWQGAAVFRMHTLAGYLSERQASTLNLLLAERAQRTLAAAVPGRPGARATLFMQRARVERRVTWQGNRPVIQVRVAARGDLQELNRMALATAPVEREVERALSDALADEVTGLLEHLQQLESDPIGFGELARQVAPYRREVQDGEAWRAAYRRARFDVAASVEVVAPGFTR